MFIFCAFLLLLVNGMGQKTENFVSYKKKYNDKNVVGLKVSKNIIIDIKNEDLLIKESNYEEIYYNSFKAGVFAQDKVQSSQFAKIDNINASTLLPENNHFKEIKVKDFETKKVISDNNFYDDLFSTTFVYPSLREGAITKLSYCLNITEPKFPFSEFLQRYYPVEKYEFIIDTDKNIELEIKYYNVELPQLNFTKTLKGNRIIYSWTQNDIKAFKIDDGSPGFRHFLPHIVPYIKQYSVKGKVIPVIRNLDDLYLWNDQIIDKVDTQTTAEMSTFVAELLKNETNNLQKVEKIYKWVQSNINYIAVEYGTGGFIPRDPKLTFERKYGDCKDMAALLVSLLHLGGLNSYYTWVGTRELPYKYSDLPSSLVDNHMITIFTYNDKYYFLDATDPFQNFAYPTSFIQGKDALVRLDKNKYEQIKVPEVDGLVNSVADSIQLSLQENNLIGHGQASLYGYVYTTVMNLMQNKKGPNELKKFLTDYLQKGNDKFAISNYNIINKGNFVTINYDFNIDGFASKTNTDLYVNLNISNIYVYLKQCKEDRVQDLSLDYKTQNKSVYTFQIPKGYSVSYLPTNKTFNHELFSYEINYSATQDSIVYTLDMKINTLLVKKDNFKDWNNMLKQINTDNKELVVLKKN
jgi:hypothetical protein